MHILKILSKNSIYEEKVTLLDIIKFEILLYKARKMQKIWNNIDWLG